MSYEHESDSHGPTDGQKRRIDLAMALVCSGVIYVICAVEHSSLLITIIVVLIPPAASIIGFCRAGGWRP